MTSKSLPRSLPRAFGRHRTAAARVSGKPKSTAACSKAHRWRCARACSRRRWSRAFCSRCRLAYRCRLWYVLPRVMGQSSLSLLRLAHGLEETMSHLWYDCTPFMNPEPLCPIGRGLEEGTETPVLHGVGRCVSNRGCLLWAVTTSRESKENNDETNTG